MNINIVPIQEITKDPNLNLSAKDDWVKKKEYEPNNFGEIFNEECRKLREKCEK